MIVKQWNAGVWKSLDIGFLYTEGLLLAVEEARMLVACNSSSKRKEKEAHARDVAATAGNGEKLQ